jgi:hypothetical protein
MEPDLPGSELLRGLVSPRLQETEEWRGEATLLTQDEAREHLNAQLAGLSEEQVVARAEALREARLAKVDG